MKLLSEIRELYRYRELLKNLVIRDIKKRYKRSALGFLWVMLDPLLTMIVIYLVFSGIFGNVVNNFTAYVISGITMWQLFSQGTKVASLAFLNNRNLLNKVYLPKSIFPFSVVMSSFIHFIFAILMSGASLSTNILFLPFLVALVFMFTLGIALTVSTLAVFYHDVIYIYDVILLAWMYLSAIFYPVSILPEKFKVLISLNPVYHFITLFRACLYDNTIPKTEHMVWVLIFVTLSIFIGWGIYLRNKDRIIFYL
jgi:ABC-type polysaccharide/polyol phosphate export permease